MAGWKTRICNVPGRRSRFLGGERAHEPDPAHPHRFWSRLAEMVGLVFTINAFISPRKSRPGPA